MVDGHADKLGGRDRKKDIQTDVQNETTETKNDKRKKWRGSQRHAEREDGVRDIS